MWRKVIFRPFLSLTDLTLLGESRGQVAFRLKPSPRTHVHADVTKGRLIVREQRRSWRYGLHILHFDISMHRPGFTI